MTETPETSDQIHDQDAEPTSTAPDEARPQMQEAEETGVDQADRTDRGDAGQTEA